MPGVATNVNFVIPLTKDELQEENYEGNRYVVRNIYDANKLGRKLQECRSFLSDNGPYFIIEHFDTFYSVIFHFQSTDDINFRKSWQILSKATTRLKEVLSESLSSPGDVDSVMKTNSLNTMKMLLYLLTQHLVIYETRLDKKNKKVMEKINRPKGKRGRKTSNEDTGGDWSWEDEVSNTAVVLYNLIELPLHRLFTPPVPEEQFVNMIGNVCYKVLEDPDMHLIKLKTLRDSVFDVLGVLIQRYNHSTEFVTRTVKLLRNSETLMNPYAKCIAVIVEQYKLRTLVKELVSHVVENALSDAGVETKAAKEFQLLVDMAEADPRSMTACTQQLTELLDEEPYTLRIAVLSILGEIVQHTLSTEQLDDEQRALRDETFEEVVAHLLDINAFVRSKTLQILLRLYKAGAIPLDRSVPLLQDAVVRLKDKMANVKKFALQLVTAYVQMNAFAVKFREEDLLAQLKAEVSREVELKAKCLGIPDATCRAYEVWLGIEQLVVNCLTDVLQNDKTIEEERERGTLKKALTTDEMSEYLRTCQVQLNRKQIRAAILTLLRCEAQTSMSTSCMEPQERVRFYMAVLSKVLVEFRHGEDGGQGEGEDEEEQEARTVPTPADVWTTEPITMKPSDKEAVAELVRLRRMLHFYEISYNTMKELNKAVVVVRSMLNSATTSDVIEAINFLTMAHDTKLEGVDIGVKKLLNLTCSPDESVRSAVAASYAIIYLSPQVKASRTRAVNVCVNLTKLIENITLGQKASLDRMMVDWTNAGAVDLHACQVMWERFSMQSPETPPDESIAAVVLLEMVWRAGSQLEMLKSLMVPLAKIGFGSRGTEDYRIAMYTCRALCHLCPKKPSADAEPFKLSSDHPIITSVANLLVSGFTNTKDPNYIPMAGDAINLIYMLSFNPDTTCEFVLRNMCAQYNKEAKAVRGAPPAAQCPANDPSHARRSLVCLMLCRMIHCVGHVGIRQAVYMEKDVLAEMKRKADVAEAEAKKRKEEERQARKELGQDEVDLDEELVGAVADDQDAEAVRSLCEKELLDPKNLLGLLGGFIVRLICEPEIIQSRPLHSTAFLALGKLMAVSPKFMDTNVKTLVSFALGCSSPEVRSNFTIIMRDLAFRYPSAMEPHLPNLFTRLRDESEEVRENAMLCSATLILSQMVKVKSCVTDLALCMLDTNKYIAMSAKELFLRMSQRGNDLYNAMPDIISRLTSEDVEEQNFDKIMIYIMGLIQKDRHHESLVEKLCTRLRYAEKERQWRDLAFCLSLISYNERSLRKLVDNYQFYADKFEHKPVLQYFESIRDKAAKQPKAELKVLLDELDMKMNKTSNKESKDGDEEADTDGKQTTEAKPATMKRGRQVRETMTASARKGKTPARRTRRGRARSPSTSYSEGSS